MAELKPCPFCGEIPIADFAWDESGKWMSIFCGTCEARGPEVRNTEGWSPRAIAAWNQRAEPPKEGGANGK